MKKHCKELERYLASGAEALPDALQAHLTHCESCRRAWQLEQGYQRALQAARSEPTPVCDVPWTRIQAKLAERAVARPRPLLWRFAPAFGAGVIALVALSWMLSTNAPNPQIVLSAEPATGVAQTLSQPPVVETASAAPIFSDTARLETPAVPQTTEIARSQAPERRTEMPAQAEASIQATEDFGFAARAMGQPSANEDSTLNDHDPASYYQIAALPLSQFRLSEGAEVHYLPFNYGNSPSEGANEHAMVGSF